MPHDKFQGGIALGVTILIIIPCLLVAIYLTRNIYYEYPRSKYISILTILAAFMTVGLIYPSNKTSDDSNIPLYKKILGLIVILAYVSSWLYLSYMIFMQKHIPYQLAIFPGIISAILLYITVGVFYDVYITRNKSENNLI